MSATVFLLLPPQPKLPIFSYNSSPNLTSITVNPSLSNSLNHQPQIRKIFSPSSNRPDFRAWADDGDGDIEGPDDYDMDEDEVEELDNKKDFDVDYDIATAIAAAAAGNGDDDIVTVQSKSFISTQGWDSEKIVDYRINEEEFHKISLVDCDFFIRKPPDPDNDVYDFREMYVTPPDTDIYAIPKVLAPMPQKYIRCAISEFGTYNVTEPPIDAPRDPMYKSETEILKVFLTKHYRNRRTGDPEFMLDFEEIYVIDSKTKSITRAKVVVTVPEGKNRDRKNDLLVIRDAGNSFKIIPSEERDSPSTVIEKEEWQKSREDMERHLRKLRDFSVSNWF
ncbi:OLC1v1016425C1 [Oldenlandia corymbosa var. corymbosa]|uniref:OLC1v1016425C1 n=1 Tax=Oldenlandia corymbosa var. corymbosa TaxID=529605 RepID=A0AAV1E7F7_OLDCO|nr:OLC1v1016425C1 [Oldenlandia corymbosa var. corymbosa]